MYIYIYAGSTLKPHDAARPFLSPSRTNPTDHPMDRDWITFILWGVVSAIVGGLFGVLYWQQAAENWRNLLGLLFSGQCVD